MLPSTSGTADHVAGRLLGGFLDAWRHLIGFAVSPADFALAVTDDHHGGKAEPATAFDNGRTAFDLHDAIEQAVVLLFFGLLGAASSLLVTSVTHCFRPLGRTVCGLV